MLKYFDRKTSLFYCSMTLYQILMCPESLSNPSVDDGCNLKITILILIVIFDKYVDGIKQRWHVQRKKTELSWNYVVVFYFSVKAMSYLSHRCAKSRHLCFYRDEPIIATKTEDASFNNMGIVLKRLSTLFHATVI